MEPSGATDRFSVYLLVVSRILRSFAAGLINLVFPFLVLNQLRAGSFILGLAYVAAMIATAVIGFFVGFATDSSRRATFIFAFILLPASTLLLVFSTNLAVVFLAATVGGYSATGSLAAGGIGGYVQPIQSAVTADVTSRSDRTYYFGLLSFISGISSAAGSLVAGFPTINEALIIATITAAASVIPGFFIKMRNVSRDRKTVLARETKEENQKHKTLGLKSAGVIGKFGVTGMINGLSNGLIVPFLIPFFILVYGVSRSEMGIYTTISGLVGSFALLLASRLETRLGFLKGLIATRGSTVIIAILFPIIRLLPVSLFLYFAFPALRIVAMPVVQTAMTDMVDRDELGRAFGINQGMRLTTGAAGTAFSGYEFDASAFELPFVVYAVVMVANLYLYVRFFSNYKSPVERRDSNG